jgi:Sodium:neurotransmitter symporter family
MPCQGQALHQCLSGQVRAISWFLETRHVSQRQITVEAGQTQPRCKVLRGVSAISRLGVTIMQNHAKTFAMRTPRVSCDASPKKEPSMSKPQNFWSSPTGFTLATIGAAVGLSSIWKFPYEIGANGVVARSCSSIFSAWG